METAAIANQFHNPRRAILLEHNISYITPGKEEYQIMNLMIVIVIENNINTLTTGDM